MDQVRNKALKKESTKEGDKNAACGMVLSSPEPTSI